MPGAAQQNGFDGRKLADLTGLIDSSVDAEAAGAVHRIRVLKKKHGDVPFYALIEADEYRAAVWEKYGGCVVPCDAGGKCHHGPECLRGWFEKKHGGGDSAEVIEARALLEKLRQDNAQLEKDGAALALAVKQQEAAIEELQREARDKRRRAVAQIRNACDVAENCFDGLFALVLLWGGTALVIACVRWVWRAVFGT
jgi:hypothetical protein